MSASFVAGYKRKLNNFQSNGYCNINSLSCFATEKCDGITTNLNGECYAINMM